MSLAPGVRLGPYEILEPLGSGGMGEVYRARDARLKRDVAIKILPDAFAADAERVARFQREAQVLASLSHPNIGGIYGVEDIEAAGGARPMRALVLELVEGPTVADRIAEGPMPLAETLPIARQIADALEAAHEQGVIHRDLKPANIKLAPDGRVKVLDFGLAKALGENSGSSLSISPTITSPAMTARGIILGTAAYMSPEQARAKPADKRSDIWAFGCVFYEMLTGKRAFEGEDVSDTLAGILRGEPDWRALPRNLPPAIEALVRRCLEKDRRKRLPDISLVRYMLDDPAAATLIGLPPSSASAVKPQPWRRRLPWVLAALFFAAFAGVTGYLLRPRSEPPVHVLRINAELGADVSIDTTFGAAAVLAPDGHSLAFVASASPSTPPSLYVRRLDQLPASVIPGTERASSPFFSPDGQWIGFFAQGKLKKVAVSGGAPIALCDAPNGRGGSWGDDGLIVFSPSSAPATTLQRVSADGGKPENVFSLAEGEGSQRWPQVLPGAKAILYTSLRAGLGNSESADVVVQALTGGTRKVLQRGGFYGRYVPSGHVLYMHQGTTFAAPFDLGRLALTGSPVPAVEGVTASTNSGGTQFAFSDTGTLVYVAGPGGASSVPIRWLDQTGRLTSLRNAPSDWSNPAFSPDGHRLAVDISDGSQTDVWVYDWDRDTLSRLTFDPVDDFRPVWSPDGNRIAFASRRGDKATSNLYWQRADGTGDVQRLTDSKANQVPTSFHPSGKYLAYTEFEPGTAADLMTLPIEGSEAAGWKAGTPVIFLKTPLAEASAMFSPDGRWLAYLSNESGQNDLFVRPFLAPGDSSGGSAIGGKWQISTAGGDDPSWSRVRHELFFASTADFRMMVAPYSVEGSSFRAEKPKLWTDTRLMARPRPPSRDLDLHPDGKRFAVAATDDESALKQNKVVFVFNFFDELRRIAPAKK